MQNDLEKAIDAARRDLHKQWQTSRTMPENDLHPDAATLQFRLQLLEHRVSAIERRLDNER